MDEEKRPYAAIPPPEQPERDTSPNPGQERPHESPILTIRIGKTLYKVTVHFSQTSKETMNDKIARLKKRLSKLKGRRSDLETLFRKIYEDNGRGQ